MAADSGAGAYSQSMIANPPQSTCDVVGSGVVPGQLGAALHQQVVQHRGGAEPEPVRIQPLRTGDLVHRHQVADRVLGRPDPAGRLDRSLLPGLVAPVPDRLQHHVGDRQGGGRADLAGRGLDEVAAGQQRQPGGAPDVVVGGQLAGLQDHLEPGVAAGGLDRPDLVEHHAVPAGQEGAPVDHHVDLVGTGLRPPAGCRRASPPRWSDRTGNAVATAATLTPLPRTVSTAIAARSGRRRPPRRVARPGTSGSGSIALRHRLRTLPSVSAPSRVVRSTIEMARSMAASLEAFLIDRVASAGRPLLDPDRIDAGQSVQEPPQRRLVPGRRPPGGPAGAVRRRRAPSAAWWPLPGSSRLPGSC